VTTTSRTNEQKTKRLVNFLLQNLSFDKMLYFTFMM